MVDELYTDGELLEKTEEFIELMRPLLRNTDSIAVYIGCINIAAKGVTAGREEFLEIMGRAWDHYHGSTPTEV